MNNFRKRIMVPGLSMPADLIDLGLPSGTLWAKGNIVKDSNGSYYVGNPEDRGCYFSWGNVDGHNSGDGYSFNSTNYNSSQGSALIGDFAYQLNYDAAFNCLGNFYGMPNDVDARELINSCTWTEETLNGVRGMRATGPNGKSVFFPYHGSIGNTTLSNDGTYGYCRTRTVGTESGKSRQLMLYNGAAAIAAGGGSRREGFNIRPVWRPLSYDYEVEYIESSGPQHIDTGIVPDDSYGIYIDMTRLNTNDRYICGFREDSGDTRFVIGTTGSKAYYGWGTYSQNLANSITRGEVELNFMNSRLFKVTPNGGTTVSEGIGTLGFTPTMSIILFAYNNKGTISSNASYRIHAFKVSKGTDVIMDLIPVRTGNTGYMYDRISKRRLFSDGTGNFTLGPDK